MNKKAQILIVSLWILVILTVVAVSIGHRVSMALRLGGYHKRRLQATYLAKAALTKAQFLLSEDSNPDYDGYKEQWADNETYFKKIGLDDPTQGYATVSYAALDTGPALTVYGMQDEERFINLNTASLAIMTALFDMHNVPNAPELASEVLAWRGEAQTNMADYGDLGYDNKGEKFSCVEELNMVKSMTPQIYQTIKSILTVHGSGKVNINTASKRVLAALAYSASSVYPQIKENDARELAARIIAYRENEGGFFTSSQMSTEKIRAKLKLDDITSDPKTKIVEYLLTSGSIVCVSQAFRIQATGYSGRSRRTILAVIKRGDPATIVFWHEN